MVKSSTLEGQLANLVDGKVGSLRVQEEKMSHKLRTNKKALSTMKFKRYEGGNVWGQDLGRTVKRDKAVEITV